MVKVSSASGPKAYSTFQELVNVSDGALSAIEVSQIVCQTTTSFHRSLFAILMRVIRWPVYNPIRMSLRPGDSKVWY